MAILIKNNRNEELVSGKSIFTNSPQFTNESGTVLTVTVDDAAYTPLSTILSEGEHKVSYSGTDYKINVYSNYMYWGAYYLKQEMKTALKNAKIQDSNVHTYRVDNMQAFPAMTIIPVRTGNNVVKTSSSSGKWEFERNLYYEVNIYAQGTSHEQAQRQIDYIVSLLINYFSSNDKRELDCFSLDMNFEDFTTDYENAEVKNGLLLYRSNGIIRVLKSKIYV